MDASAPQSHRKPAASAARLGALIALLCLLAAPAAPLVASRPGPDVPARPVAASYTIAISAATWLVAYTDDITLTIDLTNTGDAWITVLPLRLTYDARFLTYGVCGAIDTATPPPLSRADDGQLDWPNLVVAAPLAPGATATVSVTLRGARDTADQPGGRTTVTATAHDAWADPDGAGGPAPAVALPEQSAAAGVTVMTPTCAPPARSAAGGPAAPACSAGATGFVWRDADFSGDWGSDGEPGIGAAFIDAYQDDGDYVFEPNADDILYRSTLTATSWDSGSMPGSYDFALPNSSVCRADVYWIDVAPGNFAPAGPLYGMVLTSEQTFGASPRYVVVYGFRGASDINFGYASPGAHALTAQQTQPPAVGEGRPLTVVFRITNTGDTWITRLPLTASYDPAYLTYRSATPASDDNVNDGTVAWGNLAAPGGPAGAGPGSAAGPTAILAPGEGITLLLSFIGELDTTDLPGHAAGVTLRSGAVFGDPDGPAAPLGEFGPQISREAIATVTVTVPTGVVLTELGVRTAGGRARVTWTTADESHILGFNVLRPGPTGPGVLNEELILAEHPGLARGARYAFDLGEWGACGCVLEVLDLAGRSERYALPAACD